MEKAVYRREAIEKKGDAQLKSGKGETTGQLQLRLDDTKRKIIVTQQKTIQTEQEVRHIEQSQNILGKWDVCLFIELVDRNFRTLLVYIFTT